MKLFLERTVQRRSPLPLTLVALVGVCAASCAARPEGLVQTPSPEELVEGPAIVEVRIAGIEARGGLLRVGLHSRPATFPDDGEEAYMGISEELESLTLEGGVATVRFTNVAPGRYAVAVLHDEDADGELDLGTFGPTEGIGMSRDARGIFGPPPFEDAAFEVLAPATQIELTLSY